MTDYKIIKLRRGKEESLLRFHPWVFSGAIDRMDDSIEEGDTVKVTDADGKLLGVGHYQHCQAFLRLCCQSDEI